jgi:hypothetical protein
MREIASIAAVVLLLGVRASFAQFSMATPLVTFAGGGSPPPPTPCTYTIDQVNNEPPQDNISGCYYAAIGMLMPSVSGDTLTSIAVTQSNAKLFLTFYNSSFTQLSTIDLSTVGSSVTAPANTAWFIVSANGATIGDSYSLSFLLNGIGAYLYAVSPDATFTSDFDTAISSGGSVLTDGVNQYPFAAIVPGKTFTVDFGVLGSPILTFYNSSLGVISTVTMATSGVYTSPAGTAWWSITSTTGEIIVDYTISP